MNRLTARFLPLLLCCLAACGPDPVKFGLDVSRAPTINSTVPLSLAIAVPPATAIVAHFSEPMDRATITASTFTLTQGATAVPAVVTLNATAEIATLTPNAALTPALTYTASISTAAEDSGSIALSQPYTWSFTIAASDAPIPAAAAPTVTATTPASNATNVSVQSLVSATFSQAMDGATLGATTFTLARGETAVSGTLRYDVPARTATFDPVLPLEFGLTYTATITTGAKDSAGVALAGNYAWSFTAAPEAVTPEVGDTTAPTVTATLPVDQASGVSTSAVLSVTFSEAMDETTLTDATVKLSDAGDDVPGTVHYEDATHTVTFSPTAALSFDTLHTATLSALITDAAGNALGAAVSWSFTTVRQPPAVLTSSPLDTALYRSVNDKLRATFSKAMDSNTLTELSFLLAKNSVAISGAVTYDSINRVAVFTPTVVLDPGATYTATITTLAKDANETALAADYSWTFTTTACSLALIDLGSAADYVALAGSTVQNTGPTVATGDLGVSPGSAVTGFPPGVVTGGAIQAANVNSALAQVDLTAAYNIAAGLSLCPVDETNVDLGGLTLTPGLYNSTGSITINGILTLDAQGDADAVFVFQAATTLLPAGSHQIVLINNAQAANVFWQVGSSATLATNGVFVGNILALTSITFNTQTSLNGRALAQNGAITIDTNALTRP